MRKEWLWVGIASVLLSACIDQPPAPSNKYNKPTAAQLKKLAGQNRATNLLILTLIRIIKLMASPTVLSKIRRISLR